MVRIAPIKLQYNPKTLWFDAGDLEVHKDDPVVVSTARGIEFGHATEDVFEADEADVKKLKSALKPVKRIASSEDVERAEEMKKRSDEAFPIFKEMAAETSEDMHPVSVEYLLDGDKAVFYFEAEERVDFRELVKKLATKFHVRIDMRQIGVRDEARIVGGLGHCGQELCCRRLGGEFSPVSIRMAKEQDLSLNPQKISGVCGRLMCCLRYEYDAYKDFKDRAPKVNAKIETPEGIAKVVELNVPREIITLQLEDDKRIKVPLAELETPKEGGRPNKISKQAFERFANVNIFDTFDSIGVGGIAETPIFSDTPSEGKRRSNKGSDAKGGKKQSSDTSRKPRRRTKMNKDGQSETEQVASEKGAQQGQGKRRSNNRSRKQEQGGTKNQNSSKGRNDNRSGQKQGQNKQGQNKQSQAKQGPRPGQRSSGLRNASESKSSQPKQGNQANAGDQAGGGRKTRRRSHKAGSQDAG